VKIFGTFDLLGLNKRFCVIFFTVSYSHAYHARKINERMSIACA